LPGDDFPGWTERAEFGVNPLLACFPFRFMHLDFIYKLKFAYRISKAAVTK
jgi:hypothetical protein